MFLFGNGENDVVEDESTCTMIAEHFVRAIASKITWNTLMEHVIVTRLS